MSTHDVVGLAITVIVPFIGYLIVVIRLVGRIKELEVYIMAQKDITAFSRVSAKPVIPKGEDKKKEKENQDYADYMKVVNSGIADERDEKRFGTMTVDQG